MHILSGNYRSEFLATPQLVRFDYVKGVDGYEPTLLIKATTLLLKYIVRGVRMQLAFGEFENRLLYALKVYDDEDNAGILWSVLESDGEKSALEILSHGGACQVFLFNELAVNVAWREVTFPERQNLLVSLAHVETGHVDHRQITSSARKILDRFHTESSLSNDLIVFDLPESTDWKPIRSQFITSRAKASPIELFNQDEGNQQEQIGIWLTDSLNPRGVYQSPNIPKGNGYRELTDILLSYEYGSFLIESKVLSILARDRLPSRTKLAQAMQSHIEKAINQLRGGMRKIKTGIEITTEEGVVIDVERTRPVHGIVLIPDLDLIQNKGAYGLPLIHEFMASTGGFLHLLDIAELLRVVQAAEMITARSTTTTLMMAFDYYLMERVKKTVEARTLAIEVLLRFEEDI